MPFKVESNIKFPFFLFFSYFHLQISATILPLCPSIRRMIMTIRMRSTHTRASIGCLTLVRMPMDPKKRRPHTLQHHTHTHTQQQMYLKNWDSSGGEGGVYNFKLYTKWQKRKQETSKLQIYY